MDPERIDFSPLDPSRDTLEWGGKIRAVALRAAPALARRAAERSPLVMLAGWARPTLAAAAVLAGLSAVPFVAEWGSTSSPVAPGAGVVEALQLSEPVSLWLTEERAPTTSDLLLAVEDLP